MTSVFMKDLAITISLAIGFSFLASFILVPVFASRLLPLGGFKESFTVQPGVSRGWSAIMAGHCSGP